MRKYVAFQKTRFRFFNFSLTSCILSCTTAFVVFSSCRICWSQKWQSSFSRSCSSPALASSLWITSVISSEFSWTGSAAGFARFSAWSHILGDRIPDHRGQQSSDIDAFWRDGFFWRIFFVKQSLIFKPTKYNQVKTKKSPVEDSQHRKHLIIWLTGRQLPPLSSVLYRIISKRRYQGFVI